MSHPKHRRRFRRACALTLALACGALAAPAAALADGQLDPSFNGTGAHVGSAAEGTLFSNVENRLPMVVQADGKIVVGGSRGGAMTLVRYNADGSIDGTFGTGGFVTRQFAGTPNSTTGGNSGAVAMALDASGNIIVAGYGGSQSMVVSRFAGATGLYNAERRLLCAAPDRLHRPRGRSPAQRQHRDRRLRPRPPRGSRHAGHAGRHVRPARRGDPARDRQQRGCMRHVCGHSRRPLARIERRADRRSRLRRHRDGCHAGRPLLRRGRGARRQPLRARHDQRPRCLRLGEALQRSQRRRRHVRRRPPRRARDIAPRARGARGRDRAGSRRVDRRRSGRQPADAARLHLDGRRAGNGRALARGRRQQHGPGHGRPAGRQDLRRRLRQPRRQDGVRAHALHGGRRPRRHLRQPRRGHDAVRSAGDQRLHHGHRPERQHARPHRAG